MKVLIIGGYGTFGQRIARQLSDAPHLEIIIAGRSLDKAQALCRQLSGATTFTPQQLDRNKFDLEVKPDLIIDASGPFQTYDGQPVIDYAIEHSIDYADLSDDGAFTASVKARHAEAKAANVTLISGLSTCPVLSAIGLELIEAQIGPVTDVTIGIAPSPKADLGRNVVAAVANYAGQKTVPILREGQHIHVAGLTETQNETVCAPGGRPLPRLSFAVADSPDAQALSIQFQSLENIWTGAGTRPVWLQKCLVWMSRLQSRKRQGSLSGFADFFHWARGYFQFGDHRGGMFVRGTSDTSEASWHMLVLGDDGPSIPTLPAVALVRKYLRGEAIPHGAHSGNEVIKFVDIEPEFDRLAIGHGLQYDGADLPPYEKIMGDAYQRFHPAIRDLHQTGDGRVFQGRCKITRGLNPLSFLIAEAFRLPKSGPDVFVEVKITPDAKGETWERFFDGRRMASHHTLGRGKWSRLITERFGPMVVHMAILEEDGNLHIRTQGWSFLGLTLPKFLCPGGDVYETQKGGRFVFHVDLHAPMIGRLCKYEGWLEPH